MSEKQSLNVAAVWLEQVSEQLGQDPAVIQALLDELLDLTRDVAHGPSRPAAPLTAFLVGLASGRELGAEGDSEASISAVQERIAQVSELLRSHGQS